MQCPRCQQDNPPHAKFCPECGTPLESSNESGRPGASYALLQLALSEALERENASSAILRVISSSPNDLASVFDTILDNVLRLCEAQLGVLFLYDGDTFARAAHRGVPPDAEEAFRRFRAGPTTGLGRMLAERQPVHIPDIRAEEAYRQGDPLRVATAELLGARTFLAVPLLKDSAVLGAGVIYRREVRPFGETHIALLQTFADQAVIAIENVRLFKELEARNGDLTEALDRQTATAEILRVISRSQTDVQPVFDTIADNAVSLFRPWSVAVYRFDGEFVHVAAVRGGLPGSEEYLRRQGPRRPTRNFMAGRCIIECSVVHIPDFGTASDVPVAAREIALRRGFKATLTVPMLKEGQPIGVISVSRSEVGAFSQPEIDLLQTFADQAVIAIENVRLFNEIKEALEQQTATSELLKVIGRSAFDLQPVFEALAENALRLCEAEQGAIFRFDGQVLRAVVTRNLTPENRGFLEEHPIPPGRESGAGRAALERRVVHIHDVRTDPEYAYGAGQLPFRTLLSMPMLRGDELLGAISIQRDEVRPFTERQIALLETFADQAAIAIENVRLFKELEARNAELTDTLARQTATGEVLRAISRAQTDAQPVFDIIAASALRLCSAAYSSVCLYDGELIQLAALQNVNPEGAEALRRVFPLRAAEGNLPGRAIRTRAVAQIPDVLKDPAYRLNRELQSMGFRSILAVPLLRDGEPIGTVNIGRVEPGPFSDTQVELLKTFADQAVIAIENVRLFNELEARNTDLTEALEQQTATAEILGVISSSPTDVQPTFEAIARSARRLCDAVHGMVFRFDGALIHLTAHDNLEPEQLAAVRSVFPIRPGHESVTARAILTRSLVHVRDRSEEPELEYSIRSANFPTTLSVPLLRDGVPLGAITVTRAEVRLFSDKQVALLKTFADQAVIAIENVRLFTELQASNRELTTALDTQTATSDILRVISHSQTDVQPVFDAIVSSAVRLLRGYVGAVTRVAGDQIELAALTSIEDGADAAVTATFPQSLQSELPHPQAIRDRTPINIAEAPTDPRLPEAVRAYARARGYRSLVTVPMLRHDAAVGAISVTRRESGGFTDDEITLLKTFADQAVIAIENARLLTELQARTQELSRSVGELQALGEVGQAISSTLDLETVLTTIVSRAVQLSALDGGVVFEYDEGTEEFVQRAGTDPGGALAEARRTTRIRKGEGVLGRTAITLEPIQVPDITVPAAYEGRLREILVESGIRAILAVPMIREGRLIGCLGVTRNQPGDFPAETIDLLRTFATQSALAIQNARLFHEIEDKSRQLEAASRHKSEFLANMSHELRTPLNAVIGFSEVLLQRMFGALNEKQDEYLKDIYASGQHLLSLINDILDLSKIEAGRMELVPAPFHLPSALDNAVTLVRERAARHGITLELDLDPRLGELVGDERKVKQVLLNLLSNAVKFTPEGGRISLKARRKDSLVEIAVTDTGIGIAPEDQAAIFEEFRQVGSDETRKQEGTGLGLTLAKKFIELHGGRIWVESGLGRGSTFTFTLPVN